MHVVPRRTKALALFAMFAVPASGSVSAQSQEAPDPIIVEGSSPPTPEATVTTKGPEIKGIISARSSDKMKVTERYTPQGPDHIWYEATIEDPQTFSRPWKIRMPLYRHINPDARLNQFKCVEFVEELLYGKFRKTPVP